MPLSKEELEKQLETQKKARQERELRLADIHLRDAANGEEVDDNYNIVDGKPVCIGEKTKLFEIDGIEYFEVMEPGCFDEADLSDVVFNVNHGDGNHAVARTRNKTLELEVKEDGVYCKAKLDKQNPRCVQVYTDIRSGLLDKMSFAFTIKEESYDNQERCFYVRKIGKVYDVSAVEHPAYEDTSISARRSGMVETESKRAAEAEKVEREKQLTISKIDYLLGGKK